MNNIVSVELVYVEGILFERTILKSGAVIDKEQVPPKPVPPPGYSMADLKKDIDLIKAALAIG